MWIQNFFKSLTSTPSRRRLIRPRSPASRLFVEALEDRCLPSFLQPVAYAGPGPGSAVMTADLNGDGKLDLVATANNSVNVLLGNGDGTFKAAVNYAVGSNPNSVAVGDINGKAAIVTANGGDGTVSVLLGNADGTFGPAQNYAAPEPSAVHLANFDGNLDIVVVNNLANVYGTVTELPGHGDGTFGPAQTVGTYPALPTSIAVGDFNRDGKLDLAVTTDGTYYGGGSYGGFSGPAHVNILIGNGDGSFGTGDSYSVVGGSAVSSSVTAADLNGDGKLDLTITEDDVNLVEVFWGNGNSTFNSSPSYFPTGIDPVTVITADINSDGKPDLITANLADNTVSVLPGSGDGTFKSAQTFAAGPQPISVAAGDFNGDGFPDLAASNWSAGTISVLLNARDWSTTSHASSFVVSGFPSSTTAGVAGSFTVTAKTAFGVTATDYTGTVQFSSSDSKALLPANCTFTAADAGVHTFSATLKTAGTQSIIAADATAGSLTGSETGITVNSAPASTMSVASFPSPTTAGVAGNFTVTLKDPYGNIATGYTGTVHFTSSDGKASLPANYAFNAGDAGKHTFSATLKTAGTQSLKATDTTTARLTGTDPGITVNPAAANKFILTAPSKVAAGASFSLTLTVEDAYGNVVTNYTGTVHFSSSDTKATLAPNDTFKTTDKGVHTFTGLVLRMRGYQKITITDTHNSSLTGSVIVDVL